MKKFNSQICTSHSQSERLLALGLKKETADMGWGNILIGNKRKWIEVTFPMEEHSERSLPAWSLSRLLELSPKSVDQEIPYFTKDGNVELVNGDGMVTKAFGGENLYDTLLDFFYWLIKEGYFNKEYLV